MIEGSYYQTFVEHSLSLTYPILWASRIHCSLLKGRSAWGIPNDCSWSWRKLLNLRGTMRPFIRSKVGNGEGTLVRQSEIAGGWSGKTWDFLGVKVLLLLLKKARTESTKQIEDTHLAEAIDLTKLCSKESLFSGYIVCFERP